MFEIALDALVKGPFGPSNKTGPQSKGYNGDGEGVASTNLPCDGNKRHLILKR